MSAERKSPAPAGTGNGGKNPNARRRYTNRGKNQGAELPQFALDVLASAPAAGSGFHAWMYEFTKCAAHCRDRATLEAILRLKAASCGRHVPEREIQSALDCGIRDQWQPDANPAPARAPKASKDKKRIAEVAAADPGAFEKLCAASFPRVTPKLHDAASILERLFPDADLLSVGTAPDTARIVRPRDLLGGKADKLALIVPSPMSKAWGINQEGKRSSRCLDNTGPRHYAVVEFDEGTMDTQAAVIRYLAQRAPLAMVVWSGSKSLHAWFHCKGQSEERIERFYRLAITLGADIATRSRCQMVRMPLGWREEKQARQLVHFFNPENTEARKGGVSA